MSTKNLGQVSAVHISTIEPQNKNLIWRDIAQNPNLWKIWNSVSSVWEVVPSQTVANNFLNLGDTPTTYTGQGGKIVKVKLNQSGLEFIDETTFTDELTLATVKNTPLDADLFGLVDSGLKKVSWLNIKATLKTYFDTLYVSVSTVTSQLITNWNTAFGWGNHADAGYLTTESDPVFTAHPASNVVNNGAGSNYLADDGTYKPVTVPDGSKWEEESLTLIRPKDGKKVNASHIEGLESGGHVIQNAAGDNLPDKEVLQFGAGFTVTDETGKTAVKNNSTPEISAFNSILLFDKAHKVRKTTMAAPITYSLAETGNKPISFIEDIVLGDGVNEVSIPETFINTNAGAFNNTKANALIFYYDLDGRVRYTIENLETVIGLTQLATPANFQAVSGGATQINLSWDAVADATEYAIDVSDSGNSGTWTLLATTANLSYAHTGLAEGQTKHYRLRANGDGVAYSNSAYTATQSATTSSGATLATPILTVTAVDSITNNLSWTNISGETGYQLQRSSNGTSGWVTIATTLENVTSFNDNTCTPENAYFYIVKGIGNGTTVLDSAYSAAQSVITEAVLVPTLSLSSGDTQITVTIGNIDPNVDSITLERDTNSDFSTAVVVEEYVSPDNSVVDAGLTNEVIYYYRVIVIINGVSSSPGTSSIGAGGGLYLLSSTELALDDLGLAVNTDNVYGTVNSSGEVTNWKSLRPTGLNFDTINGDGTGITLSNGVDFNGTGTLRCTNRPAFNFMHYRDGGINNLKWTMHAVVKFSDVVNPLVAIALIGNNASTTTKPGFHIGYDDRTGADDSLRFTISGVGGLIHSSILLDPTTYTLNTIPANQLVVLTASFDGSAPLASRLRVKVNKVIKDITTNYSVTTTLNSSDSTYDTELGGAGNSVLIGQVAIRNLVLQAIIEDEVIENAYIDYLMTKYLIV